MAEELTSFYGSKTSGTSVNIFENFFKQTQTHIHGNKLTNTQEHFCRLTSHYLWTRVPGV